MFTRRAGFVVAAGAVWMLSAVYAWRFVDRGWIPHDEGTMAQSAERVLRGEMPHRDFDEVYTGGLTYLHAASMRMLGVSLLAPRWMLFVCFVGFVGAVLAIAARVTSAWGAVVSTVLVVVWSVPNYFASLPSWYTLFFAAFGTLACLHFLETGRRHWLLWAGVSGGLSILMKITGVYYVAAILLFLVHVELSRTRDGLAPASGLPSRPIAMVPAVVLALVLLLGLVSMTLAPDMLVILLPALLLCGFVAWRATTSTAAAGREGIARLIGVTWPFAIGVTLPVAGFALWYWQHGTLPDLVRGVFVLPLRRLTESSASPPPLASVGLVVPYALLLAAGSGADSRWRRALATALAVALGVVLLFGGHPGVYRGIL